MTQITLTTDQLWDCIYAARMQERYWKLRRRLNVDASDHYTDAEMTEKLEDAKYLTAQLETLAPEDSF